MYQRLPLTTNVHTCKCTAQRKATQDHTVSAHRAVATRVASSETQLSSDACEPHCRQQLAEPPPPEPPQLEPTLMMPAEPELPPSEPQPPPPLPEPPLPPPTAAPGLRRPTPAGARLRPAHESGRRTTPAGARARWPPFAPAGRR